MNFVSKIGDIIILDNEKKFLVLDLIEYDDNSYLLLSKVPDSVEELNGNGSYGFACENIVDGELSITAVNDPIIIQILKKIIGDFEENQE